MLDWLREFFAKGWWAALAGFFGLVAGAGKMMGVVQALSSDRSWSGTLSRLGAKVGLYLVALIIPFLLWISYLALSYRGIADAGIPPQLAAPSWLESAAKFVGGAAYLYLIAGVVLLALLIWFLSPNAGSLHGYYRDRLSRAFLWDRGKLREALDKKQRFVETPDSDTLSLTELKKPDGAAWDKSVRDTPYLLVNTAVNLAGSDDLNRRGRNADNFLFSPLYIGSDATHYAPSAHVEGLDPCVNLATAVATSGAAVSSNMGANSIPALTFSLSALNIRLGYWLPNPKLSGPPKSLQTAGIWYFMLETLGLVKEDTNYIYLTDGGHYDNLGLYELFKRRCKLVIAVDAEADPPMNFDSLVTLQRYARIDLGVLIDLPWQALKRHALCITADQTHGPIKDFERNGPHVVLGRIIYSEKEGDYGILIYLKASMSGDEGDLIRDYKRRNPDFPHETTVDQFFSEEQFEVYRHLGFHMASRFLNGGDAVASLDPKEYSDWMPKLEEALEKLPLTKESIEGIMKRAAAPTPVVP